jgi:hypothetical protein
MVGHDALYRSLAETEVGRIASERHDHTFSQPTVHGNWFLALKSPERIIRTRFEVVSSGRQ